MKPLKRSGSTISLYLMKCALKVSCWAQNPSRDPITNLAGGFPKGIADFLANRGNLIQCRNSGFAAVQGVGVSHLGNVTAYSDSRKQRLDSHD